MAEPGSDDTELVRRIRAGDRTAFGGLVRRHGGALLRLARAFVRDEAVAEEVVQDTWKQVRATAGALGRLPPPEMPPDLEEELLRRFDGWKRRPR